MTARIQFRGPPHRRLRNAAELSQCVLEVSARRALRGPRLPGWNWFVEVATEVLKRQTRNATAMSDVKEARLYLDSALISSQELAEVSITPVEQKEFRGSWFVGNNLTGKNTDKNKAPRTTFLYCHGGGYAYYPQAYANFIALITLAANTRTFALDYRLSPEHRFPAQLEDAHHAYRWLLDSGADPGNLIVGGDSAGGNLTLALLQRVRESKLPLPALCVVISPPTDFETDLTGKGEFDWIEKRMLEQWADWFCDLAKRSNPLVSPIRADLRGLPPIYIQAGRAEILYDSIQAFADCAQKQGADVVLESWEDMPHDFQTFGPDSPQSAVALRRIGQVIDARVRRQHMEAVTS